MLPSAGPRGRDSVDRAMAAVAVAHQAAGLVAQPNRTGARLVLRG
ncbi:hypothetical protein ACIPUC_03630 [Streptomyces sp. LARHCF249]